MANAKVIYERGPHTNMEPAILAEFSEARAAWHETREEVAAGLAWGARKASLLRWVRREMGRRLTPRERRFVELHYFKALSIAETAQKERVCRSTVSRGLRRAVLKLRQAADRAEMLDTPGFHRRAKGSPPRRF